MPQKEVNSPHGIKLDENVFINYNGTMLDGGLITIGDRCIIGAGSVVVKDIPADSIGRGQPLPRGQEGQSFAVTTVTI